MGFMDTNIDLRAEFKLLQKDFADDILYVRSSAFIRCTCFNILHQVGIPDCPKCGGTGRLTTIQKCNVISSMQNAKSKANMIKTTEVGLDSSPMYTFYFSFDNKPKVRDRIYLVEFDNLGVPIDIQKVCEVTGIDPVTGDNRREELYTTYARVRPELKNDAQKFIKNLGNADKNLLIARKLIVWPLAK